MHGNQRLLAVGTDNLLPPLLPPKSFEWETGSKDLHR